MKKWNVTTWLRCWPNIVRCNFGRPNIVNDVIRCRHDIVRCHSGPSWTSLTTFPRRLARGEQCRTISIRCRIGRPLLSPSSLQVGFSFALVALFSFTFRCACIKADTSKSIKNWRFLQGFAKLMFAEYTLRHVKKLTKFLWKFDWKSIKNWSKIDQKSVWKSMSNQSQF